MLMRFFAVEGHTTYGQSEAFRKKSYHLKQMERDVVLLIDENLLYRLVGMAFEDEIVM